MTVKEEIAAEFISIAEDLWQMGYTVSAIQEKREEIEEAIMEIMSTSEEPTASPGERFGYWDDYRSEGP